MTIDTQKSVSKDVLKILKTFVDDAVFIAGGAPRNWDQNLLARDIDIYLRTNVNDTEKMLEGLFNDGVDNLDFINVPDSNDIYTESMDYSVEKVVTAIYKGITFQFIFVKMRTDGLNRFRFSYTIISSFSINICKIYAHLGLNISGPDNLVFVRSPEYFQDIRDRTLTVEAGRTSGKQLLRTMKRYLPKIESYYPEYTVIIKE